MSRTFLIAGEVVAEDAVDFAGRLVDAQATRERPLCRCREGGLPMYVAWAGDRLVLKRMPLTGPQHDPSCAAYEPPPELSGRGEVVGSAIQEDATEGVTRLKLGFSLSKRGRKAASEPGQDAEAAARADGSKLTLRGLLHFLWEEAELNHWSAGMAGRRSWAVVRRRLIEAAGDKTAKGASLADQLFVPETFSADRKAEIADRRATALRRLGAGDARARPLLLLIGEVKEIAPARFGHRLIIKHLPDMPLMLDEAVHRRLKTRFAAELELADGIDGAHLLAIATFGRSATGFAFVEEIALVATTEQWLPVEHAAEAGLVQALVCAGARFVKGLRYNLSRSRPLASAVLPATRTRPTALYLVPPGRDDAASSELQDLIAASDLHAWIWRTEGGMPPLPASAR